MKREKPKATKTIYRPVAKTATIAATRENPMNGACETPMSDHVSNFWDLLALGQVRVMVETFHEGCGGHWDSASFPDDVAKAIVQERVYFSRRLRQFERYARQGVAPPAGFLLASTERGA
jgi:hypothetical protein